MLKPYLTVIRVPDTSERRNHTKVSKVVAFAMAERYVAAKTYSNHCKAGERVCCNQTSGSDSQTACSPAMVYLVTLHNFVEFHQHTRSTQKPVNNAPSDLS